MLINEPFAALNPYSIQFAVDDISNIKPGD